MDGHSLPLKPQPSLQADHSPQASQAWSDGPAPDMSNHDNHDIHPRWYNHLCNCGPFKYCLLGCFLPCVLFGATRERLRGSSHLWVGRDCVLYFIADYLGKPWPCLLNTCQRHKIRKIYNIKGTIVGDACASWYCLCCAIIQQHKEVESRGPPKVIKHGYQGNNAGMCMPEPVHGPAEK